MLLIEHDFNKVIKVTLNSEIITFNNRNSITHTVINCCTIYPDTICVWFHASLSDKLNLHFIEEHFLTNRLMLSYNPSNNFFSDDIGYVEDSPFIKVPKDVRYPTWQMSSYVGAVHTSIFNQVKDQIKSNPDFDWYLNSFAKSLQPNGLFCYSEPRLLLKDFEEVKSPKATFAQLYKFVRVHYKMRWIFLLFLNMTIYDNRIKTMSLLYSIFCHQKNLKVLRLNFCEMPLEFSSSQESVDVIIPTIGRKEYLYDVLMDLKRQTHLPKKVIVIEQNPLAESSTSLDYIIDEQWPFEIEHIFTHKTGACQARNLAMNYIESKWIFFADDDIRFGEELLSKVVLSCENLNAEAVTINCLRKNENNSENEAKQWLSFGSGCSFVQAAFIKSLRFDLSYEFGFGEDTDFGMKLRIMGIDIIFLPNPVITHLKAPVGGFRTKFSHPWENEIMLPKPSPSIMLLRLRYNTSKQLQGYKTILFFKYYKIQRIKNPVKYLNYYKKQWNLSQKWAKKIDFNNGF